MNKMTISGGPKKVVPWSAPAIFILLAAALLFYSPGMALASKGVPTEVTLGKSVILTVPQNVERVSITDPGIADVTVITPKELQIMGKGLGVTSLIVWDKSGAKTFFDISVVVDISTLKEKIAEIAPGDDVNLRWLSPDTLVVTGTVGTDERKLKIRNLLLGFGKDITDTELYILQGGVTKEVRATSTEGKGFKFVMLLEVAGPQQVLLQITVASIDRTATRALGINWAYFGKDVNLISSVSSALPVSKFVNLIQGSKLGSNEVLFQNNPSFGVVDWRNGTAYMLRALSDKGLAKILAEPNLIVKSGESGEFLAGGEFPVPIVTTATTGSIAPVTVEYKKFGITLNFKPVVKESGLIQLKLDPAEVSSLDFANAVLLSGFRIPALKKDSVKTSVDLREGETFIMAGLLREDWSKNLTKIPLLGDIPILGAFFREQQMQKTERELVFLVTPKLMKPMAPGQKAELPGSAEPTARQDDELRWIPYLPTYRSLDAEQLK